jgi:hypothetical protein
MPNRKGLGGVPLPPHGAGGLLNEAARNPEAADEFITVRAKPGSRQLGVLVNLWGGGPTRMNQNYFVSYAQTKSSWGIGCWELETEIVATHPLQWMAEKKIREANRVKDLPEERQEGSTFFFRLLSWQKLEDQEADLARTLQSQGLI